MEKRNKIFRIEVHYKDKSVDVIQNGEELYYSIENKTLCIYVRNKTKLIRVYNFDKVSKLEINYIRPQGEINEIYGK